MVSDSKAKEFNPFAINILRLQQYNFNFFSLEEVVLFEYFVIKSQSFGFKKFFHSSATITKETGIKRSRIDKAIVKFESLGILTVTIEGYPKVKHITVNYDMIVPIIAEIYQFAENNKLLAENGKLFADFYKLFAENSKLFADFYKLFAENSKQKELIKEHKQELNKKNREKEKKREEAAEKKFSAPFNYSEKNAVDFVEKLEVQYNERRKVKIKDKSFPDATLGHKTNSTYKLVLRALNELGEDVIANAWLVYCDQLFSNERSVERILPYFFSRKEGEFDVIGYLSDVYNRTYVYTHNVK